MRVWGKCNGAGIILSQDEGRWTTAVPGGKGEYILELWAEDDAGNAGYMATVLLTYDPTKLSATFRLLEIGAGWSIDAVKATIGAGPTVTARVEDVGFMASVSDVAISVKRCEICGR